jgi:hypothetical protein
MGAVADRLGRAPIPTSADGSPRAVSTSGLDRAELPVDRRHGATHRVTGSRSGRRPPPLTRVSARSMRHLLELRSNLVSRAAPNRRRRTANSLRGTGAAGRPFERSRSFRDHEGRGPVDDPDSPSRAVSSSRRRVPFNGMQGDRAAEIRTRDLLLPKQARYQTTPRPGVGRTVRAVGGGGNAWIRKRARSRRAEAGGGRRRPSRRETDRGRGESADA